EGRAQSRLCGRDGRGTCDGGGRGAGTGGGRGGAALRRAFGPAPRPDVRGDRPCAHGEVAGRCPLHHQRPAVAPAHEPRSGGRRGRASETLPVPAYRAGAAGDPRRRRGDGGAGDTGKDGGDHAAPWALGGMAGSSGDADGASGLAPARFEPETRRLGRSARRARAARWRRESMSRIDESLEFIPVRIAVLTVSDTRSLAEDRSGDVLVGRIEEAGHVLAD